MRSFGAVVSVYNLAINLECEIITILAGRNRLSSFFPHDALHSATIAVLACLTQASIVSKRIKISSNFLS